MLYALSIIFALLLVTAQSLWKVAVTHQETVATNAHILKKLSGLLTSPLFIVGAVIYVIATLLYFYLLSKYQYSFIQMLVIPLSLVFSITSARIFFSENLQLINYIGIAVIVIGIILVSLKIK